MIRETIVAERADTGWGARGLTLLASGVLLVLASNLVDIVRAHAALAESRTRIEAATAASGKAETQLNALATATATLARQGNANAAAVIATMRRNGVNIADGGAGTPALPPTP